MDLPPSGAQFPRASASSRRRDAGGVATLISSRKSDRTLEHSMHTQLVPVIGQKMDEADRAVFLPTSSSFDKKTLGPQPQTVERLVRLQGNRNATDSNNASDSNNNTSQNTQSPRGSAVVASATNDVAVDKSGSHCGNIEAGGGGADRRVSFIARAHGEGFGRRQQHGQSQLPQQHGQIRRIGKPRPSSARDAVSASYFPLLAGDEDFGHRERPQNNQDVASPKINQTNTSSCSNSSYNGPGSSNCFSLGSSLNTHHRPIGLATTAAIPIGHLSDGTVANGAMLNGAVSNGAVITSATSANARFVTKPVHKRERGVGQPLRAHPTTHVGALASPSTCGDAYVGITGNKTDWAHRDVMVTADGSNSPDARGAGNAMGGGQAPPGGPVPGKTDAVDGRSSVVSAMWGGLKPFAPRCLALATDAGAKLMVGRAPPASTHLNHSLDSNTPRVMIAGNGPHQNSGPASRQPSQRPSATGVMQLRRGQDNCGFVGGTSIHAGGGEGGQGDGRVQAPLHGKTCVGRDNGRGRASQKADTDGGGLATSGPKTGVILHEGVGINNAARLASHASHTQRHETPSADAARLKDSTASPTLSRLSDSGARVGSGGRRVAARQNGTIVERKGVGSGLGDGEEGVVLPGPEGGVEIRELDGGVLVVRRTADEKKTSPERLNLHRRQLKSCPVIEGETQLRLLNYQNNLITSITNLANLPSLIFLDLYNNLIDTLEGPLSAMTALRVVMVGKNRIQKISNVESLCKLDVLDLHSNAIQEMQGLSTLQDLRVLNLAGNRIRTVENVSCLKALTELNLRRNYIAKVAELDALPRLQRLFLSNNRIQSFHDCECIFYVGSLLELSLDGNPVAGRNGIGSQYRRYVLDRLSSLHHLDLKRVTGQDQFSPHSHQPPSDGGGDTSTTPRTSPANDANGNKTGDNQTAQYRPRKNGPQLSSTPSTSSPSSSSSSLSQQQQRPYHHPLPNITADGKTPPNKQKSFTTTTAITSTTATSSLPNDHRHSQSSGSSPSSTGNTRAAKDSTGARTAAPRPPAPETPELTATISAILCRDGHCREALAGGGMQVGLAAGKAANEAETLSRADEARLAVAAGAARGEREARERRALRERKEAIEAARICWESRVGGSGHAKARPRHTNSHGLSSNGSGNGDKSRHNSAVTTNHGNNNTPPASAREKERGRRSKTPPERQWSSTASGKSPGGIGGEGRAGGGGRPSNSSRGRRVAARGRVGYFELEQRLWGEGHGVREQPALSAGITLKVYGDVWRWLDDAKVCVLKGQIVEAQFSHVHVDSVAKKANVIAQTFPHLSVLQLLDNDIRSLKQLEQIRPLLANLTTLGLGKNALRKSASPAALNAWLKAQGTLGLSLQVRPPDYERGGGSEQRVPLTPPITARTPPVVVQSPPTPPAEGSVKFPVGENDGGVLDDAILGEVSVDKNDDISRNSTAPEMVPSLPDETEGEGNKDRSSERHTDCPVATSSILPPSGLSDRDVTVSDRHDPEGSSNAGSLADHADQAFARLRRARERALLSSWGGVCLSGVGDPSVPSQVRPIRVGADGTVSRVDGVAAAWAESGDAARLAGYNTMRRVCEAYRLENDFDHAWEAVLGRIVQDVLGRYEYCTGNGNPVSIPVNSTFGDSATPRSVMSDQEAPTPRRQEEGREFGGWFGRPQPRAPWLDD